MLFICIGVGFYSPWGEWQQIKICKCLTTWTQALEIAKNKGDLLAVNPQQERERLDVLFLSVPGEACFLDFFVHACFYDFFCLSNGSNTAGNIRLCKEKIFSKKEMFYCGSTPKPLVKITQWQHRVENRVQKTLT